ncbi:MAG TPA: CAP domain-containing protein, partial [Gemmatimonadaceae bacterium]|nr:CAP domain-containing protein [Gemmatimonadaceae bacterium]
AKISENMTFGPATAHDVVAALLIDDGITDRGHRKNILDPDVKTVGISCGPHKSFRVMCDMVQAGGFVERK